MQRRRRTDTWKSLLSSYLAGIYVWRQPVWHKEYFLIAARMNYRYLRLFGLLCQALFCLCIVAGGLITHVTFFYTFIGPAALLIFIAMRPNYYFDFIAVTTIVLMVILSLLYSFAAAVFNQNYLLSFGASAIPLICLVAVLLSMNKLKNIDASYT